MGVWSHRFGDFGIHPLVAMGSGKPAKGWGRLFPLFGSTSHGTMMNDFAGFLAAIGHRVLRTASAQWYDASWGFFLSVPSHRLLAPTTAEIDEILRCRPCFGVRFPAPCDGPGRASFQIVCEGADYGLERLSGNTRSKVRRGLKRCEVRCVEFREIAERGRQADLDTVARQGRSVRLPGEKWDRFWAAAETTRGMEGWAAFSAETMAAFLVTVSFDECVEFYLARSRDDCLDCYPNNALVFEVAQEMLARRGVQQVTFGLESLEPVGPLDEFKFSMGFRRRQLRQRVVLHPMLRRVVRGSVIRSVVDGWGRYGGAAGAFCRKAAGVLRLAEEGQS